MEYSIDPRVGVGLRAPHIAGLLSCPPVSWVEVHSENWFSETGPIAERLADIRASVDISLHGVGLSLGSADRIDANHLRKLKRLVDRCRPILVSEHLGWGAIGGRHSNDLLPLPYTEETVRLMVDRIDSLQQLLGRTILVENVSSYCTFHESTMPEWIFMRSVVERSNCGLLLDLNNVYVNARNHGFDVNDYLGSIAWERVGEIHLAGYEHSDGMLIDTHGQPVQPAVWDMFGACHHRLPQHARVLIEWDTNLPALSVLVAEALNASRALTKRAAPEVKYA
jgi:uncharacterized protein (UPF0276 family)